MHLWHCSLWVPQNAKHKNHEVPKLKLLMCFSPLAQMFFQFWVMPVIFTLLPCRLQSLENQNVEVAAGRRACHSGGPAQDIEREREKEREGGDCVCVTVCLCACVFLCFCKRGVSGGEACWARKKKCFISMLN